MKSSTDHQLMVSVRDDNCLQSFEVLVDRWRQPVVRNCYRMLFSWDDAEDITQDVFTRLFQSRLRYKPSAQFKTYLWKIAVNRCRDFIRSAKREQRNSQELFAVRRNETTHIADSTDTADTAEWVQAALKKIPPIYREVLLLRHYENLKFEEIANVLGIPFGTAASRMSKALCLLAEILAADSKTGEKCHESPNP